MNNSAVAERQADVPANVEQMPVSDLAFIERMALNPAIDPEKLERLIAMQKDMAASRAKAAFTQALVAMRPELPRIEKKGKTDKAEYGKWEDIQDAIDPVLSRHGFDLTFKTSSSADSITVTAVLRHRDGHEDTDSFLTLPADKGPGRNNLQAIGSTVSYGKRYTATAALNLRIGGEDDDGQAGATDIISDEDRETLLKLIDETKADVAKFCAYFKIASIAVLPASKFAQAKAMIEAKRK